MIFRVTVQHALISSVSGLFHLASSRSIHFAESDRGAVLHTAELCSVVYIKLMSFFHSSADRLQADSMS